jgi:hypothetical protein
MAVKTKTKAKSSVLCMCIKDGREYPSDRFYAHKNLEIFPKGYIPYCKDCCNDILQYYLKKTGTIEASIWYMCALLDIPFIKRVFEKVQDMHVETDKFFETYYTYLWGQYSTKKALDTWESFADSDVDFKDISGLTQSDEGIKAQIEELELNWGYQESEEDYKFLEYLYNKYTQGIEFENPQQEDLYRDLCLARLEKRKAEQGKIDTDITKIQGRILTIMNKLKLDDFESTKPKSLSEQLIFAKIPMIESKRPWDIYNKTQEYKLSSKRRQYYKDLVLRPTLNSLVNNRDFNIDMSDLEKYNLKDDE